MENLVTRKKEIGLYIHIPFCVQKCKYCAFLSSTNYDSELLSQYVQKVADEVHSYKKKLGDKIIKYVYIGGGTPNVLSIEQLSVIFNEIPDSAEEISIELNPGIKNLEYLRELKKLGVNRISIGVQSFSDETLKMLGRIHSSSEAKNFISDVKKAGFKNFNSDLIIGLPNQTVEGVTDDIATTKSFNPTHISAYLLSIDKGTYFHQHRSKIIPQLPQESKLGQMYYSVQNALERVDYYRYEISNHAKQGFECKYNLNTWRNGEYIGVGLGAESHFNGKRYQNTSVIKDYLNVLTFPAPTNITRLTSISDFEAAIILGLRLHDGMDLDKYLNNLPSEYVRSFKAKVSNLVEDGLVEYENINLRISESGTLLLDHILKQLLC